MNENDKKGKNFEGIGVSLGREQGKMWVQIWKPATQLVPTIDFVISRGKFKALCLSFPSYAVRPAIPSISTLTSKQCTGDVQSLHKLAPLSTDRQAPMICPQKLQEKQSWLCPSAPVEPQPSFSHGPAQACSPWAPGHCLVPLQQHSWARFVPLKSFTCTHIQTSR